MSNHYALNESLNREAALILVAAGHALAKFDTTHATIATGFQMGLDPKLTAGNPTLLVMFLHPHLLTDEEVERAEESPEARERVLVERGRRHREDAERLLPAYAECLRGAGWQAEVGQRSWSVRTVPPRAVVLATLAQLTA